MFPVFTQVCAYKLTLPIGSPVDCDLIPYDLFFLYKTSKIKGESAGKSTVRNGTVNNNNFIIETVFL